MCVITLSSSANAKAHQPAAPARSHPLPSFHEFVSGILGRREDGIQTSCSKAVLGHATALHWTCEVQHLELGREQNLSGFVMPLFLRRCFAEY